MPVGDVTNYLKKKSIPQTGLAEGTQGRAFESDPQADDKYREKSDSCKHQQVADPSVTKINRYTDQQPAKHCR